MKDLIHSMVLCLRGVLHCSSNTNVFVIGLRSNIFLNIQVVCIHPQTPFPRRKGVSSSARQKYLLLKEIHENKEGKEENMNIREEKVPI